MRCIALMVCFALVSADPAWGSVAFMPAHAGFPSHAQLTASVTFQAIEPLLKSGYHPPLDQAASVICRNALSMNPIRDRSSRRFLSVFLIPSLLVTSLVGQKTPSATPDKPVVVQKAPAEKAPARTAIPRAPASPVTLASDQREDQVPMKSISDLMKENLALARTVNANDLWVLAIAPPEHVDQLEDFMDPVLDCSRKIAAAWISMQSAGEQMLKSASRLDVINYGGDPNRAGRFNFTNATEFGGVIRDMVVYPRFDSQQSFRRWESASSPKEDPLGLTPEATGIKHFFQKLWGQIKDVALRGGIKETAPNEIEQHLLNVLMATTHFRIGFTDLKEEAHVELRQFQETLALLLHQEAEIRRKQFEIQLKEKDLAENGGPESNSESGRLQQIASSPELRPLRRDLIDLIAGRDGYARALGLQLITTRGRQFVAQQIHAPRPVQITITPALVNRLLELPSVTPSRTHATLTPDLLRHVQEGLVKRLTALRTAGVAIPWLDIQHVKAMDPLSAEFLNLLLSRAWNVQGYGKAIVIPQAENNPRRRIVLTKAGAHPFSALQDIGLDTLLQPLSIEGAPLAVSAKEESLGFQAVQQMTSNRILEESKKSFFALSISLNISQDLASVLGFRGRQVIDSTAIDHEITTNQLLVQRIGKLIEAAHIEGPVAEQHRLYDLQRADQRKLQEAAQTVVEQMDVLDQELNPPPVQQIPGVVHAVANTQFVTPAEEIAKAIMDIQRELADLVTIEDRYQLLTVDGQQKMTEALVRHVVRSGEAVQALTPVDTTPAARSAETPVTPEVSPANKENQDAVDAAKKKPKKNLFYRPKTKTSWLAPSGLGGRLGALAALAQFFSPTASGAIHILQFTLPDLQYWQSPLLQVVTSVAIALIISTLVYYRRYGLRTYSHSFWRFTTKHLPIILFTYFLGGPWIASGATFILALVHLVRTLLPDRSRLLLAQMGWAAVLVLAIPLHPWVALVCAAGVFYFARSSRLGNLEHYKNTAVRYRLILYFANVEWRAVAVQWVSRAWLLATALWMFSPWMLEFINRQLNSLHPEHDSPLTVSTEVVTKPLAIYAPPNQHGAIVNNPALALHTTIKNKWVAAWRGAQDQENLARVRAINQALAALHVNASIGNESELDTANRQSRFQLAFIQIESAPGSLEDRLDQELTRMEMLLPGTAHSASIADILRGSKVGAFSSMAQDFERAQLTTEATIITSILGERVIRDIPSKGPFELVTGANQALQGTPVDSTHPTLIGIYAPLNVLGVRMNMNPSEASTWQTFRRMPKAVAVLKDKQSGTVGYFYAASVQQTTEATDHHGFFGTIYTNKDSNFIPQIILRAEVQFPEESNVSAGRVYELMGFYKPEAVKKPGSLQLDEHFKIPEEHLQKGEKLGVVEIIPSEPVFAQYAAPGELNREVDGYAHAQTLLQGLEARAQSNAVLHQGSSKGSVYVEEANKLLEDSARQSKSLEESKRRVENEKKMWSSTGISVPHMPGGQQQGSLIGLLYPIDSVAHRADPLKRQFPSPGSKFDSYYMIGPRVRIRVYIDTQNYKDMQVKPGESLTIRFPWSTKTFELKDPYSLDLRERGMQDSGYVFEGTMPAEEVPLFYPQIQSGEGLGVSIEPVRKTAPKTMGSLPPAASRTTHAGRLAALLLISPVALMGSTFKDSAQLVGVLAVLSIAAYLLIRFAPKLWMHIYKRTTPRRVQATQAAARVSANTGQAIFYSANGLFPSRSKFLEVIGAGRIHNGTIESNWRLRTLKTNWTSMREKIRVSQALEQAVARITNIETLDNMALELGVRGKDVLLRQRTYREMNQIDVLRWEITIALIDRFESLNVAIFNTREGEPLFDVGRIAGTGHNADRILYIDAGLLDLWLKTLEDPDTKNPQLQQNAQDALLLTFYFAVASPNPTTQENAREGTRQYYLDQAKAETFLERMDELYAYMCVPPISPDMDLSSSYAPRETPDPFTVSASGVRRERDQRTLPFQILSDGRERELGTPGLHGVIQMLKEEPSDFEIKRDGQRISGNEILFNVFSHDSVTRRMARFLNWHYQIETYRRQKAQERTTFIGITDILWLISVGAWLIWPMILVDIWKKLVLSNFTWALFWNREDSGNGVPQAATSMFLVLLVVAFFQGVFKSAAEWMGGHGYLFPRFLLHLWDDPNEVIAKFRELTRDVVDVDPMEFLHMVTHAEPVRDDKFRASLTAYARTMIHRITEVLNKAPRDMQRRVVQALYAYERHPLHRDVPFFTDLPTMRLPTDAEIMETLGEQVRLRPVEIHWLFYPEQSTILEAVRADIGQPDLMARDCERLTYADQMQILISIRRHGFPFADDSPFKRSDSERRDLMELQRVRLALGKMKDYPLHAFIALVSRDLGGLAFAPKSTATSVIDRDSDDLLRSALEAFVHRLRTLSPEAFNSYREWSRYTKMGWQFYDGMQAIRTHDEEAAKLIENSYAGVFSNREVDLTRPQVQEVLLQIGRLTPHQQSQVRFFARVLLLPLIEKYMPMTAVRMKRRFGLLIEPVDPEERLAMSLLFSQVNVRPDRIPQEVLDHYPGHEVDLTGDYAQTILLRERMVTPRQIQRAKRLRAVFFLGPLSRLAPRIAQRLKRRLRLIVSKQEIIDHAEPFGTRAEGAQALADILDFKLKDIQSADPRTVSDELDVLIASRELYIYRTLSVQHHLDLKWYLTRYIEARQHRELQQQIVRDYTDRIHLAPGLQSGLIFQWSRRLLKSDPREHETLSSGIHSNTEEPTDEPWTFPKFLIEKFLQNKNLEPTISLAGLFHLHDQSSEVWQRIIGLASDHGPRPYGDATIVQEAALDPTLRQSLRDVQADARSTTGDIYRVAVSYHGLKYFIRQMAMRIVNRVDPQFADRIHPTFLFQIIDSLHQPSRHPRIIFISPELESFRALAEDKAIKDAILVGVPNPFLINAAKVFAFWTLMPNEKKAYLDDVLRRFGPEVVTQLETDIEELLFTFTSFSLQFQAHDYRYEINPKTGQLVLDPITGEPIDVLNNQRPPLDYRTMWGVAVNGNGAHAHALRAST